MDRKKQEKNAEEKVPFTMKASAAKPLSVTKPTSLVAKPGLDQVLAAQLEEYPVSYRNLYQVLDSFSMSRLRVAGRVFNLSAGDVTKASIVNDLMQHVQTLIAEKFAIPFGTLPEDAWPKIESSRGIVNVGMWKNVCKNENLCIELLKRCNSESFRIILSSTTQCFGA